jgi:hypothetical protein
VWKVATSPHFRDTLGDIERDWSIDDLYDAHDVIDMLDELDRRTRKPPK